MKVAKLSLYKLRFSLKAYVRQFTYEIGWNQSRKIQSTDTPPLCWYDARLTLYFE